LLGDTRPVDRVVTHYLLERELSDRIRRASREDRASLYSGVYTELFASLPDHPQHSRRSAGSDRPSSQLHLLAPELRSASVFLEIGCGDASLAFAAAARVGTVYGVDVTDALIDYSRAPSNFQFVPTGGVEIPLPGATADLAFSDQVLEHLHPDDAANQIREVYRILKTGGRYVCITPSRVTGPHDVSCYFDYEATCLHLREYDYASLRAVFRAAGFRKFACIAWVRGCRFRLPYALIRALEFSCLSLPNGSRAALTRARPASAIFGLNLIATK
jgi:SAM-dependent methyltransferase